MSFSNDQEARFNKLLKKKRLTERELGELRLLESLRPKSPAEEAATARLGQAIRAMPLELPKDPAGPTVVGSVYRVRPALEEKMGMPTGGDWGVLLVVTAPPDEEGRVEVTAGLWLAGLVEQRRREGADTTAPWPEMLGAGYGKNDRVVWGASSPYAMAIHHAAGAFLLHRWPPLIQWVSVQELERAAFQASNTAARLIPKEHLCPVWEVITPQMRQQRRRVTHAWQVVFPHIPPG